MGETIFYTITPGPLGNILLAGSKEGLSQINFQAGKSAVSPAPAWLEDPAPLAAAVQQLAAYFAGELRQFDLPLAPRGTEFQLEVWHALQTIPYGQTISYAELAQRVGRPNASRAVGAANGRNPLPIVVPCHRVIGADGSLTGYGGGIAIKKALLSLEKSGRIEVEEQLPLF